MKPKLSRQRQIDKNKCRTKGGTDFEFLADQQYFSHFTVYILTRGDMNNCFVHDRDIIFQI
jgi:hypothetical protein